MQGTVLNFQQNDDIATGQPRRPAEARPPPCVKVSLKAGPMDRQNHALFRE